jgi:outer membrane protein OmpU
MNNLKRLGLTALAGSLAAVGAQAGEMSVNGSANFTYKTNSASEGKGIGTDKGLTVSGSGELDNGWTISTYTYLSDAMGLSSHATSLTMGSLGTITAGQGWGGNSTGFDEEVPQAYEQISDLTALGSSNLVGSYMDNGGLTWAVPSFDLGGATASVVLGFSPNGDDVGTNNGAVGTRSGNWGAGYDGGLTVSTDMGLTVGVYASTRENSTPVAAGSDAVRDEFNGVWYAKYSAGPVSVGISQSYLDYGAGTAAVEAATAAKAVRTAGGIFEERQISIAFNVNDNVSISWTDAQDTYDAQSNVAGGTEIADVDQDSEALQISYSMGGMSIKAYQMERTNPAYDSDATKHSATEISVGLAF